MREPDGGKVTDRMAESGRGMDSPSRPRRLDSTALAFLQILVREGLIRPRSEAVARRILTATPDPHPYWEND